MTDDRATADGSDVACGVDLLGQIPVGALTDGEAAMLMAWAETIAAQRVAAERERIALKLRGLDCAHGCSIGEELAAIVRKA